MRASAPTVEEFAAALDYIDMEFKFEAGDQVGPRVWAEAFDISTPMWEIFPEDLQRASDMKAKLTDDQWIEICNYWKPVY